MRRVTCTLLALLLILGSSASARYEETLPSGVAYEIFVSSFADSNGDGLGDLKGIEDKLDYISSLGADMIWLTPFYPSPSYHHYDVTDYMDVSEDFGGLEAFDGLIAACHARGIRVIIDLVANHTSAEHPWFIKACQALSEGQDSLYIDYYSFSTDSTAGYAVNGADGWYYEGAFGAHMPDLNLDSQTVRSEIASVIAFWLERGADGFRLDAVTSYYTGAPEKCASFVGFITDTARGINPDAYIVGECWADQATILTVYQSGIDSLFNFPTADVDGILIKGALAQNGAAVMARFAAWHDELSALSPAIIDAPFLTNHDLGRARGMLRSDMSAMKAAAMLYLLLPGRPFVYYGEEIGMSGSGIDENKRLPMLWSAEDTLQNVLPPENADQGQKLKSGVDVQDMDPESLLNWYRSLIALRTMAPQLNEAGHTMTALDAGDDRIGAFTYGDTAVIMNVSYTDRVPIDLNSLCLDAYDIIGQASASGVTFDGSDLPPLTCVALTK